MDRRVKAAAVITLQEESKSWDGYWDIGKLKKLSVSTTVPNRCRAPNAARTYDDVARRGKLVVGHWHDLIGKATCYNDDIGSRTKLHR